MQIKVYYRWFYIQVLLKCNGNFCYVESLKLCIIAFHGNKISLWSFAFLVYIQDYLRLETKLIHKLYT
jgi:hypothetical protein